MFSVGYCEIEFATVDLDLQIELQIPIVLSTDSLSLSQDDVIDDFVPDGERSVLVSVEEGRFGDLQSYNTNNVVAAVAVQLLVLFEDEPVHELPFHGEIFGVRGGGVELLDAPTVGPVQVDFHFAIEMQRQQFDILCGVSPDKEILALILRQVEVAETSLF